MTFYKTTRDMLFSSKATFKDRFQLTSLLLCWKKTRLEIQNFITIFLELADLDNSECKANIILKA